MSSIYLFNYCNPGIAYIGFIIAALQLPVIAKHTDQITGTIWGHVQQLCDEPTKIGF